MNMPSNAQHASLASPDGYEASTPSTVWCICTGVLLKRASALKLDLQSSR